MLSAKCPPFCSGLNVLGAAVQHLHFVSFLHIDTMQVVEILPQERQEPT